VDAPEDPHEVLCWLNCFQVRILNVACPREGKHCPIYDHAYGFLIELLAQTRKNRSDNNAREPEASYFASRLRDIEDAPLRCP